MTKGVNKAFVYGVSVDGDNFTDRVKETARLKKDFENGLNVVLISPRRMGKTSLVNRVIQSVDRSMIQPVYVDIYDCRSEYDFYNKFAVALLKQTANRMDLLMENYAPEEILQLPELISQHIGKHIVMCIDEFQQVAEWPDSLSVQKRMRGVWQHHRQTSYCLFGSRKHMMTKLFQDKGMPFYQFGEPNYLQAIPTADWIPFVQQKYSERGLRITEAQVTEICQLVEGQSSYIQQLAWNIMVNTDDVVTEDVMRQGVKDLLDQQNPLFIEQLKSLTTYQMNMLRAIAGGLHSEFTTKKNMEEYKLGAKSNISRLQNTLVERDLVEFREDGLYLTDPVLRIWLSN